jgi:hypothetical protein
MSERVGFGVIRDRNGNVTRVLVREGVVTTKFYNIRRTRNGNVKMLYMAKTMDKETSKEHVKKVEEFLGGYHHPRVFKIAAFGLSSFL